ncbi:MAG: FAD-dependent monooxygenase [Myxococcales bacterium]|nr:FAD-dependent monooxygenase [Myxococcales bacterium]MCB9644491.1 FAD-dependent monooxygenase [Myxococcales bacterium]
MSKQQGQSEADRVLVVGGGIAGLAMAICMLRQGRSVEVVERAETWRPLGAGIVLQCNATAVLRLLGVEGAIKKRGRLLEDGDFAEQSGRSLSQLTLRVMTEKFGPSYGIHRALLHESLLEACEGADIHMGETVTSIEQQGERAQVTFSSGRSGEYDLVIGADGLHSKVRELIWPEAPKEPTYAGYVCWRFICENVIQRNHMTEMVGRGRRFGLVPIGDNKLYCFTTLSAPADYGADNKDPLGLLRELFKDFGGDVPAVLASLTEETPILWHPLADIDQPYWYRGRVVLIGDACHAMTPNMGQGAAQALEDVGILGSLLHQGGSIEEVLQKYRKVRETRVKTFMKKSRQFGKINQWSSPFAASFRNLLLRMTPTSVIEKQSTELIAGFSLVQSPSPLF